MEDCATEDAFDDFLIDDDLLADALPNEYVETDDARQVRLIGIVDSCITGSELLECVTTKLPVSGQKFGTSLSMNRALVYLKSVKLCVEATPTWASSKRTNKDYVATVFSGIGENTPVYNSLKSVVLEGFHVKKEKNAAKNKCHQVLILDEQDGPAVISGRAVDRYALLACALVDPELHPMFTTIFAPIESNLRPAFLDLGAVHVTLARWTDLAELVMQRRDGYSNPFKSVFITAHGTVLADIDRAKGLFYSTASTPMSKQFKDLLTAARKSKLELHK